MRTEISVEIERPIEEVFERTFECVPEWSIIVVEDEPIEEKPEVIGSTFKTITEENARGSSSPTRPSTWTWSTCSSRRRQARA
jgi:hypothetical protein